VRQGKVDLYLLRKRANSPELLEHCATALKVLSASFGPFPYERFGLVEVDFKSRVLGTSEYGFIFADRSQFDSQFNLMYWAHEMAHQWWGVLVKSKGGVPGQMLLSEGVAQFAALETVDTMEGADRAALQRQRGLLNPKQSVEGYRELVIANRDLPLATYIPKSQDEILLMHQLANSKGMMVLWMLANQLGQARFVSMLKEFVSQADRGPRLIPRISPDTAIRKQPGCHLSV
jgi:hypothetical protein